MFIRGLVKVRVKSTEEVTSLFSGLITFVEVLTRMSIYLYVDFMICVSICGVKQIEIVPIQDFELKYL